LILLKIQVFFLAESRGVEINIWDSYNLQFDSLCLITNSTTLLRFDIFTFPLLLATRRLLSDIFASRATSRSVYR